MSAPTAARGIPSSPRRSHRAGPPKSKKVVEEDDGGQTRCVCNQQHHEGVMIQCETCKVWQHCPCVGLGDGEVTPDKYYCDSCRPENHPYRVQDGQLISISKKVVQMPPAAASPAKSKSKKRSTMNSKDASLSSELLSDHHTRDDDERDSASSYKRGHIVDDDHSKSNSHASNHTRNSKRRKKTASTMDELDVADEDAAAYIHNGTHSDDEDENVGSADKGSASPPPTVSISPKAAAKGKTSRAAKSKKPTAKIGSNQSPPDSPILKAEESDRPDDHHDSDGPQEPSQKQQAGRRTSGKKAVRSLEDDRTTATEKIPAPSSKRRKTIKSDAAQQETPVSGPDPEDPSYQASSNESGVDSPDVPLNSSTASHSNINNNNNIQGVTEPSLAAATSKRTLRKTPAHKHSGDTPTPSGTPQPMQPAPPSKIKYPSPRMSLKDMSKRAQQLLDFIGRAQVEMSELKNKNEARRKSSSLPSAETAPSQLRPQSESAVATSDVEVVQFIAKTRPTEVDAARWLSTPPQSVHELSHSDSAEPLASKQGADAVMGLHKQSGQSSGSGSGLGCGKGKAPMTPPPQLNGFGSSTGSETDDDAGRESHDGSGLGIAVPAASSLDLMDKLT
ncbi:hypothetical protein BGZ98_004438, partial [Dissophora globulifera]